MTSVRPALIHVDEDAVDSEFLASVTDWLGADQELYEDSDERCMNFSSKEVVDELSDDERPEYAIFDIALLQKFIEGDTVEDFKPYVLNQGEYNGTMYYASPQNRRVQLPPQREIEKMSVPRDYSKLEEALLLFAFDHTLSKLHTNTIITECIKQTLEAFSGEKDIYPRTTMSILEKFKSLNIKMARWSDMRVTLCKVPIVDQRPDIAREYVNKLKDYDTGKLMIRKDGNSDELENALYSNKFQVGFNQRDVQTMLNAARWDYQPGTKATIIGEDFYYYYGQVHNGKKVTTQSWGEFFKKRVIPKASDRDEMVGEFYYDRSNAEIEPSKIKNTRLNLLLEHGSSGRKRPQKTLEHSLSAHQQQSQRQLEHEPAQDSNDESEEDSMWVDDHANAKKRQRLDSS